MIADNFFNSKFDSYDYFNKVFTAKDVIGMLKEFGKIQVEEFRQELLKKSFTIDGERYSTQSFDVVMTNSIEQTEIEF